MEVSVPCITLSVSFCPYFVPDVAVNLLWNVHRYYTQFLPSVQAQLTKLRTPIEKELKVGTNKHIGSPTFVMQFMGGRKWSPK